MTSHTIQAIHNYVESLSNHPGFLYYRGPSLCYQAPEDSSAPSTEDTQKKGLDNKKICSIIEEMMKQGTLERSTSDQLHFYRARLLTHLLEEEKHNLSSIKPRKGSSKIKSMVRAAKGTGRQFATMAKLLKEVEYWCKKASQGIHGELSEMEIDERLESLSKAIEFVGPSQDFDLVPRALDRILEHAVQFQSQHNVLVSLIKFLTTIPQSVYELWEKNGVHVPSHGTKKFIQTTAIDHSNLARKRLLHSPYPEQIDRVSPFFRRMLLLYWAAGCSLEDAGKTINQLLVETAERITTLHYLSIHRRKLLLNQLYKECRYLRKVPQDIKPLISDTPWPLVPNFVLETINQQQLLLEEEVGEQPHFLRDLIDLHVAAGTLDAVLPAIQTLIDETSSLVEKADEKKLDEESLYRAQDFLCGLSSLHEPTALYQQKHKKKPWPLKELCPSPPKEIKINGPKKQQNLSRKT